MHSAQTSAPNSFDSDRLRQEALASDRLQRYERREPVVRRDDLIEGESPQLTILREMVLMQSREREV